MLHALARLTKPHTVTLERDDGTETTGHAAPLIQQLRDAIFGEDGRNGGVAESRARLPLSAPALDLYQCIDDWITEVWVQRFQRVPGIEHPEHLLAEWAEGLEPDTLVIYTVKKTVPTTKGVRVEPELTTTTVAEFITMLAERIVALLERPTVQVPVKGPCPAPGCWATTVTRRVDGDLVTSPTLEFTREQLTGDTLSVSCQSCGAHWDRTEFRTFAEALAMTERGVKPHQFEMLHAAT